MTTRATIATFTTTTTRPHETAQGRAHETTLETAQDCAARETALEIDLN